MAQQNPWAAYMTHFHTGGLSGGCIISKSNYQVLTQFGNVYPQYYKTMVTKEDKDGAPVSVETTVNENETLANWAAKKLDNAFPMGKTRYMILKKGDNIIQCKNPVQWLVGMKKDVNILAYSTKTLWIVATCKKSDKMNAGVARNVVEEVVRNLAKAGY